MNYQETIKQQRDYFLTHTTKDLKWREHQLKQLKQLVLDHENALLDALKSDLNKPHLEGWMTETSYVVGDIDHTVKKLTKWSKPRRISTPIVAQPGSSYVKPEPLGTILIMSAWNYPVQLILAPLVAVIAAGNCAVLKPSEIAPATSSLIAKLIPQYMDPKAFSVVEGGVEETTELLKCRFDHIIYTGNSMVAKIVMTAAAKHLTPVTLELGGKSPVFIDESAPLTITAQRLAWGKWLNAGQTCIAPDYVLTTKEHAPKLIEALKLQIKAMYGKDPKQSDSYGRIINQRHAKRIASYLEGQNVVHGGEVNVEEKYIAPTIVMSPELDSPLMTEEIFGSILPIITVDNFQQAKDYVLSGEKPLSSYIFTKDNQQEKQWLDEISSGNLCINDVIMFNAVPELPFGGVGNSGMGQYSGKSGFDNFSHLKSVLKRPFLKDLAVRFAPYTNLKWKLLRFIR